MSISAHNEHLRVNPECPNLVEWTGWKQSFCRLRYSGPDILTCSEISQYCKNDNYSKCSFYAGQPSMGRKGS